MIIYLLVVQLFYCFLPVELSRRVPDRHTEEECEAFFQELSEGKRDSYNVLIGCEKRFKEFVKNNSFFFDHYFIGLNRNFSYSSGVCTFSSHHDDEECSQIEEHARCMLPGDFPKIVPNQLGCIDTITSAQIELYYIGIYRKDKHCQGYLQILKYPQKYDSLISIPTNCISEIKEAITLPSLEDSTLDSYNRASEFVSICVERNPPPGETPLSYCDEIKDECASREHTSDCKAFISGLRFAVDGKCYFAEHECLNETEEFLKKNENFGLRIIVSKYKAKRDCFRFMTVFQAAPSYPSLFRFPHVCSQALRDLYHFSENAGFTASTLCLQSKKNLGNHTIHIPDGSSMDCVTELNSISSTNPLCQIISSSLLPKCVPSVADFLDANEGYEAVLTVYKDECDKWFESVKAYIKSGHYSAAQNPQIVVKYACKNNYLKYVQEIENLPYNISLCATRLFSFSFGFNFQSSIVQEPNCEYDEDECINYINSLSCLPEFQVSKAPSNDCAKEMLDFIEGDSGEDFDLCFFMD